MNEKSNRSTTQAHDAQVIVGIERHLQNVSSLALVGTTFTPAELVKLIQSRIDSTNAAAAARANLHLASEAHKQLSAHVTQVIHGLRQVVLNMFGSASPVLADFGFSAPKKPQLTPEQKAAAAAKRKATREARHTLGRKQKAKIHGAVAPGTAPTATVPKA